MSTEDWCSEKVQSPFDVEAIVAKKYVYLKSFAFSYLIFELQHIVPPLVFPSSYAL